MPAGELPTVPLPVPASVTESVGVIAVNRAETMRAPVRSGEQLPVPVQSPAQPSNVEPVAGVAFSVTGVEMKSAAQAEPQSMPGWFDCTLPSPVPMFESVTCAFAVPESVAASLSSAADE